ncbi:DUF1800 family protein [Pseudoteredinibacter isoporae]|uniref:Uncharacterized protein (DUF1800 family) n=1 Tax=Pseudoteredinibacter isoporae TaxID=570281 RepID=A0A7X0JSG5_9GAMM|nr:DUF1800 family protein [Pseudoteredinibacter isoporae]MBB6520570.1 uncharacterized protein (DUF1800 family) [Pseudoteredinibacter isoporae]NHO86137.1 DUF1800 domain-containing protein [Pseudoteredinibacter isoporae]NIB25412.1 DUF1800 domain-containing protein [Pseudoteredinibacter isoporae]
MGTVNQASRFLMQASLGANRSTIEQLAEMGPEAWLQWQLNAKAPKAGKFQRSTNQIWQYFRRELLNAHGKSAIDGDGNNPALPYKWYFHMAWWQDALGEQEHLLRQRVAQALSELLVISDNSSLELDAVGMASFYDLLYDNAFGSYADLLYHVSMHPCMGVYLSHMNNQKAVPAKNIHPDENYAREIMQLFSIGLFMLNPDGSLQLDEQGNSIPSYHNRDIRELARVFTGLTADSYRYEWNNSFWSSIYNDQPVSFNDGVESSYKTVPFVNMRKPMVGHESHHDRGRKELLDGFIQLPGGQSVSEEVRQVVDRLVAHPNTAPFVAKHLIQQMVTSNPSGEYIAAVAEKFGARGDLAATIQEVLTYPLHHPVNDTEYPAQREEDGRKLQSQKLKSPLLRLTQILRAFNAKNRSGYMWLIGDDIQEVVQQHPVSAPTVFNFYKPDFVPQGMLKEIGEVAPEFEIHTSATSIAYVNLMYYWFFGQYLPGVSTEINQTDSIQNAPELNPDYLNNVQQNKLRLDFSEEIQIAQNPARHDELIDRMSQLLLGRSQPEIKPAIRKAFQSYRFNPEWVVQTIAFMLTISPEFTVLEV